MSNIQTTLPNGLVTWKYVRYKVTNDKAQIIKVNNPITNIKGQITTPGSVDIQLFKVLNGIPYKELLKEVSPYDLEVWNESMQPYKRVVYRTKRKHQVREVQYGKFN